MNDVRSLADRFHEAWLAAHPFAASNYGIPGHDDEVPDDSEAGAARWRTRVEATIAEAGAIEVGALTPDDVVTLGCVREAAEQELAILDAAAIEHTVTAMPFHGPAVLLATAARTVLPDEQAADDYLERLRRAGTWLDQQSERLEVGAAKGRLPVAPLVEEAIAWAERVLADPVPAALVTPSPPEGWAGEAAWRQARDRVGVEVVRPALGRWVALLRELRPRARSGERPGLVGLPGGEADYHRAIRSHTTLALSADELHQIGLEEIERIEARLAELGGELGLSDLAAIHEALRASSGQRRPEEAIEDARAAIRRAEARAVEVFPEPLPPPCAVTPMPAVVGESGMAPHYTPPRLDGSRPGTFWFNLERPTAGTGWDLEGVAFHEAVPGHHLQLSRIQLLDALPALQRQRSLTVFSEGWGLYAEQLAEEVGLYRDTRGLLGAASAALLRAARLVVDTGLHAFGWSRAEALRFFTDHVPMPPAFLANEIDRYLVMPGQALAYLTGKLEILRLRDESREALGEGFALPEFHAALLDRGSLPLPVLRDAIDDWVSRRSAGKATAAQSPGGEKLTTSS